MLLDARVIMANFQHKKIGLIRSFMLSHIYWCMETLLNTILANFTHRNMKKYQKTIKTQKTQKTMVFCCHLNHGLNHLV